MSFVDDKDFQQGVRMNGMIIKLNRSDWGGGESLFL